LTARIGIILILLAFVGLLARPTGEPSTQPPRPMETRAPAAAPDAAARQAGATDAWLRAIAASMAGDAWGGWASTESLSTSTNWTAESDQVLAEFGSSVATAGDVNADGYSDVIVGAYLYTNGNNNEGRAWLYLGSASGLATSPAWTVEANQDDAKLGISVATAGDVNGDGYSDVIIGAWSYTNGQTDEGRAYVFHGTGAGLAGSPSWTAESNQAMAGFGGSVACAGDVNGDGYSDVIVGASDYDNGESNEGRAYIYLGSTTGLATAPARTLEGNQIDGNFGWSVATAGDVNGDNYSDVIVGASLYDNGQADEGRAFVYLGSSSGVASSAAWTREGQQDGARFGHAVGAAGDVNADGYSDVIVSAHWYNNDLTDEGRAFVYHGSSTGLSLAASWIGEGDQTAAQYGSSVSTAGDVNGDGYADIMVGAWRYNNGQGDEGRAYVYLGSAAGTADTAAWMMEPNQGNAQAGNSVAIAGDVNGDGISDVIVGAHWYDNGQVDEGRAFVYHGATVGLAEEAAWTAQGDQFGALFGSGVAGVGDVNGDGYGDIVVGAQYADNGEANEGRAFLYLGSTTGPALTPSWTGEANQGSAQYGIRVAGAGDVNGDGYADVIVGANLYDNGQEDEGRAWLYLGSASGLSPTAAWTAEGNQVFARLGFVAPAGDVNGDGYADVIVGAYSYTNGQESEGRAYVYMGMPTGLNANPSWTGEGNVEAASYGSAIGTAGDVNGDGYSDIIVGAKHLLDGLKQGRVWVHYGSATGVSATAAWVSMGGKYFGASVGTAGDVNGDGYSDIIVGAEGYSNGQAYEGQVSVFHGSAAGLALTPAWTVEGNVTNAFFGHNAATAGDVNGDGYSDVIIGTYSYDHDPAVTPMQVFVYHGTVGGLEPTAAWARQMDQFDTNDWTYAVSSAGDVNGDGYGDVIFGISRYDGDQVSEGGAWVHLGNDGISRQTFPRQQRTDSTTPIATLGRSDSETQFRIRAIMLSYFGRTRIQMESEAKPRGTLFNGLNTVQGTFTDIGSDGIINFNRLVSGLTPNTLYHWRVRARYDLTKTPFQRNGPWIQVPAHGWNEADLRTGGAVSAVTENEAPPPPALLEAAEPNPFAQGTKIAWTLPHTGPVRLAIYDVSGRVRKVLVDDALPVGRQTVDWDGRDEGGRRLSAGVYFAALTFEGRLETQKLVLAR